jgi:SulP family sulfate permease
MMEHVRRWVPSLSWLPKYKAGNLRGDLSAGLTTAIMLIPQGMAYAMLAGLPPIVGLYASVVPLAVYALLGTSRELAVGPVAMVSLLVASGVGALAPQGTPEYVALAVLLALLVGVIQIVMGVARLGFLTNFLSHPVLSGFTSAAALIIGFSQLKPLMGVSLPGGNHIHVILWAAVQKIGEVNPATLALGLGSVAVLLGIKKWRPMFPGALVVVLLGTLLSWGLGLKAQGVSIVGEVPAGFPTPSLPGLDWGAMKALLPTALTISLVGFMESISVGKSFARKGRYELDPNQELVALGGANLAGSFFGIYPVTGGISRTAVNAQAGAKTPLASLLTAALVALSLVFFTPLFYYLPKAVLAAIIMTAVFGMIDVKEVKHLWHVKRSDLALLGITFAATLSLGIEEGILAGVGASLLWFVVRTTRPHTAELGRLPESTSYRNVARFPEACTWPGLLILRVDAQFYFGNVSFLKETLAAREAASSAPLKAVVIDASSINQLDSSADAALHELYDDYQRRGIKLSFAHVKGPVRDVMQRSGLYQKLGEGRFFFQVHEAVQSALQELAVEGGAATPCEAAYFRERAPQAPARARQERDPAAEADPLLARGAVGPAR